MLGEDKSKMERKYGERYASPAINKLGNGALAATCPAWMRNTLRPDTEHIRLTHGTCTA